MLFRRRLVCVCRVVIVYIVGSRLLQVIIILGGSGMRVMPPCLVYVLFVRGCAVNIFGSYLVVSRLN